MSSSITVKVPRICFDANCFIALFQGEVVEGIPRGKMCQRIVEDARAGKIELFVSWSAVTECRKTDTAKVEAFFENTYIIKCDVDKYVALKAREVAIKSPRKIQTLDALQIATAIIQKVDYLFTYDVNDMVSLSGHNAVEGLHICAPHRPWDTQLTIDEILSSSKPSSNVEVTPEAETHEPVRTNIAKLDN